jgi:hypothetical protein
MRQLTFRRGKEESRDVAIWQLREYNGTEFVDARIHFERDGEPKPTQKGVTIRKAEIRELIAWLEEAADELDAPEPRERRERRTRPSAGIGAGPELSPEEEAELF